MTTQWLVTWDFATRPSRTFYDILCAEFGPDAKRVQQSVYLCRDDFTARRLRALAEWYGASVVAYAVTGQSLDDATADAEAKTYVARVHQQRLSRRGRPPGKKNTRKR